MWWLRGRTPRHVGDPMISHRPGRHVRDVTVMTLAAGAAGLTLVSGCALADMSKAELAPLRAGVVREICAGQTAKSNPGDVGLLKRQSPEVLQRTSEAWGVDLGSWLAGRSAVGTSPACRAPNTKTAPLPSSRAASR